MTDEPTADGTPELPKTRIAENTRLSGTTIGPYKLLQQIGEGGMGSVWMAEQEQPVRRRVALKLIKSGVDSKEVIARFEAERQALAMMDHQNIAKVLDAGTTGDGSPYFVMELVKGIPITKYCDDNKLDIKQRLKLFVPVCKAIQHAHQKGIIHRDLKPSNVLVTLYDGEAVPKVIDFGLAKALEHTLKLTDKTMYTEFGKVVGTVQYMSPEQAEMNQLDVDTRTDVYSLGVMLYELLTGSTPLDRETINQQALLKVLEIIREQEPPRPSARLNSSGDAISGISQQRQITPSRLQQILKGELDWLVMKALEKDRSRRYRSASSFADDIERYLSDEPVLARPPSVGYRLGKFCKKRRSALAAAVGMLFVVCVILYAAIRLQNSTYARSLVKSLSVANTADVEDLLVEIRRYQQLANPLLREIVANENSSPSARLHAALALLPIDKSVLPSLRDRLLTVTPTQFEYVRDLLDDDRDSLVEYYWKIAKSNETAGLRFQAACALASYDADNAYWRVEGFRRFIADHLTGVRPSELLPWTNALRPVKEQLVDPLSTIYRNPESREQVRSFATDTLGDYWSDNPDRLFDLLADATEGQFGAIISRLDKHREKAVALGNAEVARTIPEDASEKDKESLAIRQSNAAVMLLRMEADEQVWPLLKHSRDPRVRSYIIHWLSPRGGDSQTIIDRYKQETDVTIRRALLLCLGEFELSDADKQPLVGTLLTVYRSDPDSGLHAAVEWLLRQWEQDEQLAAADIELQQAEAELSAARDNKRQWYVNRQGQTFVILDAGEFQMGSPKTKAFLAPDEDLHLRSLGRRIAVSTKEVTHGQWRLFSQANSNLGWKSDQDQLKSYIRSDDSPMNAMTWYEAAHYCNWLSEQEGIPEDQWCYNPNSAGEYGPGMRARENFLELTGYRLPTESEWEYCCRSGTASLRYYGSSDSLLAHYAWYDANAKNRLHPVASLKPNDFGLFGMQGNVYEWCFDAYREYPVSKEQAAVKDAPPVANVENSDRRVLRGGGFNVQRHFFHSANRDNNQPTFRSYAYGFRLVRTYHVFR